MLLDILAAAAIAAALTGLFWLIQSLIFRSVPAGRNTELKLDIGVKGSAPELEQTVDALLWLRHNGVLQCEIYIVDEGMDCKTRQMAELISRSQMIELK